MAQTKRKEPLDWHKADVKAALEKAGTNLHQLGQKHGYAKWSMYDVFKKPCPRLERIVAAALGLEPWEIWPSRYDANGRPLTGLYTVKSKNR